MKISKDIILNSAEALMCGTENPMRDITVDKIAKNAGIGKGSIYYYFNSKEEIIDAVIERSYTTAVKEYFANVRNQSNATEKIKTLFRSMIAKEFTNRRGNVIRYLHLRDDIQLHYKMIMMAIKTVSPLLTDLLAEGAAEGIIHTDAPKESAEMIVAMLTFLLDSLFFPADDESTLRKLRLYANVLETCLETEKGSFDFLFTIPEKL